MAEPVYGGTDEEDERPAGATKDPFRDAVLYHTLRAQKLQDDPLNPMFSPEEVALRQAENDYQQRMGRIFSLSGDKRTSDLGGKVLNEAMQAARMRQLDHGQLDPISGQFRAIPEVQRQREVERNETQLFRATQLAEQDRARREAQERGFQFRKDFEGPLKKAQEDKAIADAAKAKAEADLKAYGKNVDVGMRKTLTGVGEAWDELNQLQGLFRKNDYKPPKGGWSDIGYLQDWAVQKNPQLAPKDWVKARDLQGLFTKLATLKQRHDIFGAVLPPKEFADFAKTQPPRGASREQLDAWFAQEIEIVTRALRSITDGAIAGKYNPKQVEAYTRGFYTAPEEKKSGSGVVEPGPQGGSLKYNFETGEVE